LIALIDFPEEERTEIKLLTVSIENIGKQKQFDRIAGCLIAFAAREAVRKFKKFPALSLIPKTELKQHYISKYNMADAGWQLYLEDIPIVECY
jgi:DTW domain-containing protein YfiP